MSSYNAYRSRMRILLSTSLHALGHTWSPRHIALDWAYILYKTDIKGLFFFELKSCTKFPILTPSDSRIIQAVTMQLIHVACILAHTISIPIVLALPATSPEVGQWVPPKAGDGMLSYICNTSERANSWNADRGPCPMLNTLANHGYLPRNGRNISKQMAIRVLDAVLNWDESVVSDLYDFAQPTNPEPSATTINLKQLTTHNILEHDASLR